jgi:hypothetical protein
LARSLAILSAFWSGTANANGNGKRERPFAEKVLDYYNMFVSLVSQVVNPFPRIWNDVRQEG